MSKSDKDFLVDIKRNIVL